MPSVLRLLLPQLRAHRPRLGRLQLVVSSGEPLAWGTARELAAALPRGTVLVNLYGECGDDEVYGGFLRWSLWRSGRLPADDGLQLS